MESSTRISRLVALAAVAIVSLSAAESAKASTFSIVGGASGTLLGSFNPSPNPDGIGPGTPVRVFSALNSGGGLFVDPGNANLVFTFYGFEATNTNVAEAQFIYNAGSPMFSTTVPAQVGTSVTVGNVGGPGPSLVNFLFADQTASPDKVAVNGGPIGLGVLLGFYVTPSAQTAYAFFDDTGRGLFPDLDGDDMVVKITFANAVPLPGALSLFASGLAGLGLLGWRRKRKNATAVAAV